MKLRNKKTGEIKEFGTVTFPVGAIGKYETLADLNEEWEDYEEPKGYFFVRDGGNIDHSGSYRGADTITERRKSIGNYFETEEEALQAVEELKAWRRLTDRGFRFIDVKWHRLSNCFIIELDDPTDSYEEQKKCLDDIDLLFNPGDKEC